MLRQGPALIAVDGRASRKSKQCDDGNNKLKILHELGGIRLSRRGFNPNSALKGALGCYFPTVSRKAGMVSESPGKTRM